MGKEGKGRGVGGGGEREVEGRGCGWEIKRYMAQGRAGALGDSSPRLGPRLAERRAAAYLLRAGTTDTSEDNHVRAYAHSCRKAADITR